MSIIPVPELGHERTSQDSMDAWFSVVENVHTTLSFRHESSSQFAGTMSTSSLGNLRACDFRGTALTASRTARDIARRPQDTFIMIWQFQGHSMARQRGQESRLEPGSVVFLDLDTPYEVTCSDGYGQLVIHVPTPMLSERLRAQGVRRDVRGAALKPAPQVAPWLAFLGTAFSQAQASGAAAMAGLCVPATDALAALAGLSLSQQVPEADAQILLQAARRVISTEYWRSDFTADYLAGQLHVSRRTLFRALETGQASLTQELQDARLEAAARMLVNPACSFTVEAVGLAVGYQSTSTFHTRFRERFGASPGAYRRQEMPTGTFAKAG